MAERFCAARRMPHGALHSARVAPAIIFDLPQPTPAMEADRLNLIDNSLQDLSLRAAELRRYL
jgi:hypothetical protein